MARRPRVRPGTRLPLCTSVATWGWWGCTSGTLRRAWGGHLLPKLLSGEGGSAQAGRGQWHQLRPQQRGAFLRLQRPVSGQLPTGSERWVCTVQMAVQQGFWTGSPLAWDGVGIGDAKHVTQPQAGLGQPLKEAAGATRKEGRRAGLWQFRGPPSSQEQAQGGWG